MLEENAIQNLIDLGSQASHRSNDNEEMD